MTNEDAGLSRRELLKKGLIWGGAGTAALALGGAAGSAVTVAATEENAGERREGGRVVYYDVACLGDTFRVLFAPGASDSGDLRGSTFSVEGSIYPEGTIEGGDDFDPASAEAIGRWFCRGWFLINPERPEPHVITTQEYVVGAIEEGRLFPPDQLVSSGTEGSEDEKQPPIRSVIGGTGRYLGAKGGVHQYLNGTNTTRIEGLGPDPIPAPNFRFVFELA